MTPLTGFIKIHRKISSWEWYDNDVVKSVFLHLLLNANYKERSWKNVTVKPGQVLTSVRRLSNDLNHTVQQTRTALAKLESTNDITIRSTNKFSLITVVNWGEYQSCDDFSSKQNNDQNNIKSTIKQHAAQQTTQQHLKKKRNKELKEYFYNADAVKPSYDIAEFERRANELPVYKPRSGPTT